MGEKRGLFPTMLLVCLAQACGSSGGRAGEEGGTETGIGEGTGIGTSQGEAGSSGAQDGTTSSASASDTSDSQADDSSGDASDTLKFDLMTADAGTEACDCGGQGGFSYIWIANSNESTVSKINTETMVEEGRYYTRADAAGSPSRTSVSLTGDAVAVANRNGGVTKVWARPEFCDPNKNGMAGIQTSDGPANVLAWDQDDCVAWHTPFDYTTQRPVAWIAGAQNPETCEYEDQAVWTSGCNYTNHANVQVHLLDGNDGTVLETVEVTGFPCTGFGAYGGAVDSMGNFWITSNEAASKLALIRKDDLSTQVWISPLWGYGMTVDSLDRPWLTANVADNASPLAAARFDPVNETWDVADNIKVKGYSGIQEGTDGRMWLNYSNYADGAGLGIAWIDRDTMMVGGNVPVPAASGWINGMSIDLEGRVWAVSPPANTAFRYDPDTQQMDSYAGLDYPYTYSDMTGWQLQNASCGPQG